MNPLKTAVCVNTNLASGGSSNALYTLSLNGALAYMALRGIPAGNLIEIDFGPNAVAPDTSVAGWQTTIQDAVAANGYTSVLFSLGTPYHTDSTAYPASTFCNEVMTGSGASCGADPPDLAGIDSAFYKYPGAPGLYQLPTGRIGFPTWDNTSTALENESITLMQARVADAIAAEGSGTWASGNFIFGPDNRIITQAPAGLADSFVRAMNQAQASDISVAYWVGPNGLGALTPSFPAWDTNANVSTGKAAPMEFMACFTAGLINPWGQPLSPDYGYGYAGGVSVTYYTIPTDFSPTGSPGTRSAKNGPYADSFLPQPGSLWFNWTSYGYQTGTEMVNKGCCSYISANYEPSSAGITTASRVLNGLLMGLTLAEVCASCNQYAQPVGDPMYRPYKLSGRMIWLS